MLEIEEIFHNKLTKRSDKWQPYFHVYEKHLSKFRHKKPRLLEIGIQGGGSLEMWRHYFGDGCSIHGVDCDPEVLNHKYDFEVDITIGDQESVAFWREYSASRTPFDIIIDDGGHTMKQQENTLFTMFGKLKYGGVFIIEDTHTSYWSDFGAGLNHPLSFVEKSKALVDIMNYGHIKNENSTHGSPDEMLATIFHGLASVSFYDSMIVLEKEFPREFKRVFSM